MMRWRFFKNYSKIRDFIIILIFIRFFLIYALCCEASESQAKVAEPRHIEHNNLKNVDESRKFSNKLLSINANRTAQRRFNLKNLFQTNSSLKSDADNRIRHFPSVNRNKDAKKKWLRLTRSRLDRSAEENYDECRRRCERLLVRSLARIGYSPRTISAVYGSMGFQQQLGSESFKTNNTYFNDICWKYFDYSDCAKLCKMPNSDRGGGGIRVKKAIVVATSGAGSGTAAAAAAAAARASTTIATIAERPIIRKKRRQNVERRFHIASKLLLKDCKISAPKELLDQFRCVHKFRTFLDVQCSSYAKEALRLRIMTLSSQTLFSRKTGGSSSWRKTADLKAVRLNQNSSKTNNESNEEICRFLHYHSMCLANSIFQYCPTIHAAVANDDNMVADETTSIFNRFTLRDYFLSFILPLPEQEALFSDVLLDECQLYDFQKMAKDIYASTRTYNVPMARQHSDDEDDATSAEGVAYRSSSNSATDDSDTPTRLVMSSPLPFSTTTLNRRSVGGSQFPASTQKNENARHRLFSSEEDLADTPPNFYYSSAKYDDLVDAYNYYSSTTPKADQHQTSPNSASNPSSKFGGIVEDSSIIENPVASTNDVEASSSTFSNIQLHSNRPTVGVTFPDKQLSIDWLSLVTSTGASKKPIDLTQVAHSDQESLEELQSSTKHNILNNSPRPFSTQVSATSRNFQSNFLENDAKHTSNISRNSATEIDENSAQNSYETQIDDLNREAYLKPTTETSTTKWRTLTTTSEDSQLFSINDTAGNKLNMNSTNSKQPVESSSAMTPDAERNTKQTASSVLYQITNDPNLPTRIRENRIENILPSDGYIGEDVKLSREDESNNSPKYAVFHSDEVDERFPDTVTFKTNKHPATMSVEPTPLLSESRVHVKKIVPYDELSESEETRDSFLDGTYDGDALSTESVDNFNWKNYADDDENTKYSDEIVSEDYYSSSKQQYMDDIGDDYNTISSEVKEITLDNDASYPFTIATVLPDKFLVYDPESETKISSRPSYDVVREHNDGRSSSSGTPARVDPIPNHHQLVDTWLVLFGIYSAFFLVALCSLLCVACAYVFRRKRGDDQYDRLRRGPMKWSWISFDMQERI